MSNTARWIPVLLFAALIWAVGAPAQAPQSPDYNLARRQYVDRIAFLLRQTFDARFVRAEEAEATILLRYAADGKLLEMVLEERSGDAAFDAALYRPSENLLRC